MTDRSRSTTIDVMALGPPEVHGDGDPITLPPKLLAVLIYLAVAPPGRAVRRDAGLALFWPDLDRQRALDLYRGDFIEGSHVSGAPDFERWMDGVRARASLRATARRTRPPGSCSARP